MCSAGHPTSSGTGVKRRRSQVSPANEGADRRRSGFHLAWWRVASEREESPGSVGVHPVEPGLLMRERGYPVMLASMVAWVPDELTHAVIAPLPRGAIEMGV